MNSRDIVKEILSIKARDGRNKSAAIFGTFELQAILKAAKYDYDSSLKLIPIRSVTFIEVFFRSVVAEFVDAGEPYISRAEKLFSAKLNFKIAFALHGQTITIGQLIAHTISFNNLYDINSILSDMLNIKFFDAISEVCERCRIEIEKKVGIPILGEKDLWYSTLEELFLIRHRIVHETSLNDRINKETATIYANTTEKFLNASWELLSNIRHPNYPLTQTDMNIAAGETFNIVDDEIKSLIITIEEEFQSGSKHDESTLNLFRKCNETFGAYRLAEMMFSHNPEGGGSIGPTIRASKGEHLTRERIKLLSAWLNRRKNL